METTLGNMTENFQNNSCKILEKFKSSTTNCKNFKYSIDAFKLQDIIYKRNPNIIVTDFELKDLRKDLHNELAYIMVYLNKAVKENMLKG